MAQWLDDAMARLLPALKRVTNNAAPSLEGDDKPMQDSVRAKSYHRTGRILSVSEFVVDLAVLLTLLFTGWSIALRTLALHFSVRPWIAVLIYLTFFGIISQAVVLPIHFLRGFWLEHRYELSNLTLAG
jgi:cytochrome b subunit of formate dehydrogenase